VEVQFQIKQSMTQAPLKVLLKELVGGACRAFRGSGSLVYLSFWNHFCGDFNARKFLMGDLLIFFTIQG